MRTSLALVLAASGLELTAETWDTKTAGKTVFLKFLAPWEGHCKKMKPDWDKLMEAFANHESTLVADVDCTKDGKELCESFGVRGYPTLKYGSPSNMEDYTGKRDFASLETFAKGLKPVCSIHKPQFCEPEMKAKIEKFQKMSKDDYHSEISTKDAAVAEVEKAVNIEVEKLRVEAHDLKDVKDAKVKDVKDVKGLEKMKEVKKLNDKRKQREGKPSHPGSDEDDDEMGGREVCKANHPEFCDAAEAAKYEEYLEATDEDLDAKIAENEAIIAEAEKVYKEEVAKLQAKGKKLVADKEAKIDAIKDPDHHLMKAVKKAEL